MKTGSLISSEVFVLTRESTNLVILVVSKYNRREKNPFFKIKWSYISYILTVSPLRALTQLWNINFQENPVYSFYTHTQQ